MKKVVNYIIAFAAGYKFASRKTKRRYTYNSRGSVGEQFVCDILCPNIKKCITNIVSDTIWGPKYEHKVDYTSIKPRRHRGSSSAVSEFIDIWEDMPLSKQVEIVRFINETVKTCKVCTILDVNDKFNLEMTNVTDNWGWKIILKIDSHYDEVIDNLGFINWEELR